MSTFARLWRPKSSVIVDYAVAVLSVAAAVVGNLRWTQRAYRNLIYFNEVDKGGHFAAWE